MVVFYGVGFVFEPKKIIPFKNVAALFDCIDRRAMQ